MLFFLLPNHACIVVLMSPAGELALYIMEDVVQGRLWDQGVNATAESLIIRQLKFIVQHNDGIYEENVFKIKVGFAITCILVDFPNLTCLCEI